MAKKGKRWGPNVTYIRDWRKTNEIHVQRGIYYLDFEWVINWDKELEQMNNGKQGAPFRFPESLINLQALWCQNYNYRAVEGITRQVCRFAQIPEYNDYTTIWRRVTNLDEEIPLLQSKKDISAATDGTGIKMNMSGEYFEDKYGDGKKKYIKVTITADPYDKDLLKVEVSIEGEGLSEPQVAEKHMNELIEEGFNVKEIFGDGAMDTHRLFDFCDQYKIDPIIKIRENAVPDPGGNCSWRRGVEVKAYQEKGYKEWSKEKHYGRRWPGTEGIFSAVKRMFGERVRSKKVENMLKEAYRRFWCYQILKSYGERVMKM